MEMVGRSLQHNATFDSDFVLTLGQIMFAATMSYLLPETKFLHQWYFFETLKLLFVVRQQLHSARLTVTVLGDKLLVQPLQGDFNVKFPLNNSNKKYLHIKLKDTFLLS